MNNLLDSADAAAIIGVTTGALAKWRCEGEGPPYLKIGRMVRYRGDALESWIASYGVNIARETADA